MFIELLSANLFITNPKSACTAFSFFPAMLQTAPTTPLIIFLFVLFLIGIFLPFFLIIPMIVGWYGNKQLLISGEQAQAKILKIWETGAYVNEQPQVGMLLEVYAANRPVYRAEAKRVVSILNIPRIQVGATVEVRFDPQNPSRIAVVL